MRVSLAMLGFGNVGQAFAEVLVKKGELLKEQYDLDLRLVSVVDSCGAAVCQDGLDPAVLLESKKKNGSVCSCPGFGHPGMDALTAMRSVKADMLIEASPTSPTTGEPALTHIKEALAMGMHVASANKGPIALAYSELMRLSAEKGLSVRFAAAVGAPLPGLELGEFVLQGCHIKSIEAILNGTSNCIIDYMESGKGTFEEGLKDAQRCGIAEADPSLDVQGWDTTLKIVILANALMGPASVSQVHRVGVDEMSPEMVEEARRTDKAIKLLGSAFRTENGLEIKVEPTMVSEDHPLYPVRGLMKGITIDTDLDGRMTAIGDVSDPISTAAAVLRDIVNIARFVKAGNLALC